MIGRILGAIGTLFVWLCVGTVISEVLIAGYLVWRWQLTGEKLLQMIAVAQGVDPFATQREQNLWTQQVQEEQPSYEEYLTRRLMAARDLELQRIQLQDHLNWLRQERAALATLREEHEKAVAEFNKQKNAEEEAARVAGRDMVRGILESLKPDQAKAHLWAMIQKGELDEAAKILTEMSGSRRAKILAEFQTPEELSKLDELLARIRDGKPLVVSGQTSGT